MVDENKYKSKLSQDTMMIMVALGLLVVVELYVVYSILSVAGKALPGGLMGIYIVFVGLVIGIETIGYWKVRHSINEHMHEFEYYD